MSGYVITWTRDNSQRRRVWYRFSFPAEDIDGSTTRVVRNAETPLDIVELGQRAAEWLRGWHPQQWEGTNNGHV